MFLGFFFNQSIKVSCSLFGLFFGFIRSYVICICLFSAIDIVYNYSKWPINTDKSYAFPYIEKGSNYLLKEFPNEKNYQDSKEKIEELLEKIKIFMQEEIEHKHQLHRKNYNRNNRNHFIKITKLVE